MDEYKFVFDFLPDKVNRIINDEYKENGNKFLEEIRIRINKRVSLKYGQENIFINYVITKEEMESILEKIFKGSRYTYQNEIINGFVTIDGGHRIGLTGEVIIDDGKIININNISSLNIRISRMIRDVSTFLDEYIVDDNSICNTLIVSIPGQGKTTILKDLIRRISDGKIKGLKNLNVSVVDERGELANDTDKDGKVNLGERTDVISNISKDKGMKMLIRSMAPNVIVVDEIGTKEDVEAIKYAVTSGIKGIFTAHGDSFEKLFKSPILRELIDLNIIERIIILSKTEKGKVEECFENTKEGYKKYVRN